MRYQSYPQPRAAQKWAGLILSLLLLSVPAASWATPRTAASGPWLAVAAPAAVEVGQPIALTLTIHAATDLAGYEATLLYDPAVAEFNGLRQRDNALQAAGREPSPLGGVELPNGVAFGLFSCPWADCSTPAVARQGGQGDLELATVFITPRQAGVLELKLDALKFVAANGDPVAVSVPTPSVQVQVGGGGSLLAAPAARWQLLASRATAARPLDLTKDQRLSYADALDAAVAWQIARERGNPCAKLLEADRDLNGDGCLDVSDLQLLAASFDQNPPQGRLALNQTFTVTSAADMADYNLGDGICAIANGTCTLRAAIAESNMAPGPNTINFNIPGTGVQTIQLNQALPKISDDSGPLLIDGYTQPGAQPNTDALISNAQLRIQITSSNNSDGFIIVSPNNVFRGLALFALQRSFLIYGRLARGNQVLGTYVGTNAAGTYAAPGFIRDASGIVLTQGAAYTRIGTPVLADRNVISGNGQFGIMTSDEGTDHNVIQNNLVGLSPDGLRRVRNSSHGIDLNRGSSYNLVGGTGPHERNVVSGNAGEGVEISHNQFTVENRILGNYIGTDVTGTRKTVYGYNSYNGVHLEDGVSNNVVAENVIGNNGNVCCIHGGILLEGYYTQGNQVYNNRIGLGVDGSPISNVEFGVHVRFYARNNTIGPNNVIAHNPVGIVISDDASLDDNDQNTLTQNSIYANTTLGIDLGPNGPNVNEMGDNDDGPNDQLNYPMLWTATPDKVTGIACGLCRVELFVSDRTGGAYGQPQTFVGGATALSDGRFEAAVSGVALGAYLTATATDQHGNTSEASPNRQVTLDHVPLYASDSFTRALTQTWGMADIGGAYATNGTAADFRITSTLALMTPPTAGSTRFAYLPSVLARDVDGVVRVHTDKPATGNGQYASLTLRRVSADSEYRARLRFAPNGTISVALTRVVANAETLLTSETTLPGLTQTTHPVIWLRVQALGAQPTSLRLRAWPDGQAEPSTWLLTASDATAGLQFVGNVGLRGYDAAKNGSPTATFTFAGFQVAGVEPFAPLPTPTPTPPPPITGTRTVALDRFARTLTDNWGSAEVGGAYALATLPSATEYDVNGTAGTMLASNPGVVRAAYLTQVRALDSDAVVRLQTDRASDGANQYLSIVLRRSTSGNEYRARIAILPTGAIYLQANRTLNNTETAIGPAVQVVGLSHAANTLLWLRAQVIGTNPAVIQMKAWRDGQPEPTTWRLSLTDSEPALQAPGGVGLRVYTGSAATSQVLWTLDDFQVTTTDPVGQPNPTPESTPTPEATPTLMPSPTAEPTPTVAPTSSPTVGGRDGRPVYVPMVVRRPAA